ECVDYMFPPAQLTLMSIFFSLKAPTPTEIYPLSLHDALPISGKERDTETGFTYHGARYYAPWLGRWLNADPIGHTDGLNVFAYRSEEHTSELQSRFDLVCRLLLEKKKTNDLKLNFIKLDDKQP